jgi:hypothetical protein
MAALRLLLQRYAENLPRAEVDAALSRGFAAVRFSLGAAPEPACAAPESPPGRSTDWAGWGPLRRRLRLLEQDAAQVALSKAAIEDPLARELVK